MSNIEGIYSAELCMYLYDKPLRRYGELKLYMDGEQLKGSMFPTFFWLDRCFRGGKAEGGRFSFTVYFSTPCQQWSMDVSGIVEGDKLTGTASTPMGDYQLTGIRKK